MGNVNEREDGFNSSSRLGPGVNSVQEDVGVFDGTNIDNHITPEIMGQSPPHSPRAIQSPLMFTPQVPVVPLQRPDEIHMPNPSWMESTAGYEDISTEQAIPTMITWSHGGKEASLEGSWDDWKIRTPLQRSGKDFTIMKVLPSGVYQYRFIVDGQWRYAPDLPWAQDDAGNTYNILDLQSESGEEDNG